MLPRPYVHFNDKLALNCINEVCLVFGNNLLLAHTRFCYISVDNLWIMLDITEFVSNLMLFCLQPL